MDDEADLGDATDVSIIYYFVMNVTIIFEPKGSLTHK